MNVLNVGPSFGEKLGSALAEALGATVEQKMQLNEAARKRKAEAAIGQRFQPLDLLGGIEQRPAVQEAKGYPETPAQQEMLVKPEAAVQPQAPMAKDAETFLKVPPTILEQDPLVKQQSAARSRLLTPAEKQQSMQRLLAAGLTPEQAESRVASFDARAREYRQYQSDVGNQAKQIFGKYFETLDPDLERFVENEAEKLAVKDSTESEVNSIMNQKAKQIKNSYSQIAKGVTAVKGFYDLSGDKQLDTLRSIRSKVKPLVEMGLVDVAKDALSQSDLEAEDIERIVGELNKSTMKQIASFPRVAAMKAGPGTIDMKPEQREKLADSMQSIIQSQPGVNLVSLRHEYNKKGVDWRNFRSALQELENRGIKLTDEQQRQIGDLLDQPPLADLHKYLNRLFGRKR